MKIVQACLYVRKDLESSFHNFAGPVKLVQACLGARKDLESSFHNCVGPVKLVQACLSAGKIEKAVFTAVEVL